MKLIKKLANLTKFESGANYALGHSMSNAAVANMFGGGGNAINVLEEYNGFAWKCINIRAETLSNEDLYMERGTGDKWTVDNNHEFNAILEGGEGQNDQSELLAAHSISKDLYGESFWYFSKGERFNKPMAVYLLDPAGMTVMVANNRVVGYKYMNDGQEVLLDLDEVMHFKTGSHPSNPYRGYGPMQAAGWFIRSNRYVNTYVNNFLENNAIPAGVIVAKEGFTDDADWSLFKKMWADKFSGTANAGKTAFVKSASLEFVKTGMSLGEVDFTKIKDASREDIMIMFGISKPMMAIFDDINRASAVVARQLFATTITEPELRRLKRKLTKMVAKWYGAQYRVGSTNPVPEDDDAELAKYDKLLGRAFTVNEVRAAYGLEPIPDGDVLNPAVVAAPSTTKSLGKITITKNSERPAFGYEMKESFRGKMESLQEKYEQMFLQKTNPLLKEQKAMVLDQLMPKKLADAHFDAEDEAKKLSDELMPVFVALASEQGQLAAVFAGNNDSKFVLTDTMKRYIEQSVAKASLSFTKETQAKIAEAIATGLTEGESIGTIGKRIDTVYSEVLGIKSPGYRIERLARTEVIKSSNEITEAAYKQSGVVQKKEWFANPGACEFCKSLNGNIVGLGSVFVPKGATLEGVDGGTRLNSYEDVHHPPTHPACRCTLVPVIEELR